MTMKKKANSGLLIGCGVVLIVIAICMIVWFLLRGEEKVSGGFPEAETSKILSCESSAVEYPLFSYANVVNKNLKIYAIYSGNNLSSISLKHELVYGNNQNATHGETINHSAMNISFSDAGLPIDTLRSNYSLIDNVFTMTLYGRGSDVTDSTKKYLMINGSVGSIESLSRQYTALGLKCIEKNG